MPRPAIPRPASAPGNLSYSAMRPSIPKTRALSIESRPSKTTRSPTMARSAGTTSWPKMFTAKRGNNASSIQVFVSFGGNPFSGSTRYQRISLPILPERRQPYITGKKVYSASLIVAIPMKSLEFSCSIATLSRSSAGCQPAIYLNFKPSPSQLLTVS